MNIVFRVDAALHIGSGHVMRCLTLADELTRQGASCLFICREFDGNLCSLIKEKGYELFFLSATYINLEQVNTQIVPHEHWLGVDYSTDALQTIDILNKINIDIDWLIVDHYAIDIRWESMLRPYTKKIMLIDDLADRKHDCDLLLDQNLGSENKNYQLLVKSHCTFLIGTSYALIRNEFILLHQRAKYKRSVYKKPRTLLVTLGGVDKNNVTSYVIRALTFLQNELQVNIIVGKSNPNVDFLREQLSYMPSNFKLFQDVRNIAEFYLEADLCIGAGGSSSWERCVLGLPSINIILEKNQIEICQQLEQFCAGINFGSFKSEADTMRLIELIHVICGNKNTYLSMSQNAFSLCDGFGCQRVSYSIMGR